MIRRVLIGLGVLVLLCCQSPRSDLAALLPMTPAPPTPTIPTPAPSPTLAGPPTPVPSPTINRGAWQFEQWVDSLTRARYGAMTLVATDRSGYGSGTPRLLMRCQVGSPVRDVFILWDEFVGDRGSGYATVRYRFGSGPLQEGAWAVTAKETGIYATDRVRLRFIRALSTVGAMGSWTDRVFMMRVWRYDSQTITASWHLAGADAARRRLTDYCGPEFGASTPTPVFQNQE